VDAGVGGVFLLERFGGVDGLLGLLGLVIEGDQVELGLARLGTERIAALERLEVLDGARVVRRLHRRSAPLVDGGRALGGDGIVVATGGCEGGRDEAKEQRFFQQSMHGVFPVSRGGAIISNNRGRFAEDPVWTMEYSRKFPRPRRLRAWVVS